jgi:hypothetical protein
MQACADPDLALIPECLIHDEVSERSKAVIAKPLVRGIIADTVGMQHKEGTDQILIQRFDECFRVAMQEAGHQIVIPVNPFRQPSERRDT